MTIWEILLIGLGLSMDAVAVSMSNAMCMPDMKRRQMFQIAGAFGLFQGLMPIAGYFAGSIFASFITKIGGWIAFLLLGYIGGKMLYDGIQDRNKVETVCKAFTFRLLVVQALATSIDALAVGVSFAALRTNIFLSAGLIALTTFLCSLAAIAIGKRCGDRFGYKAEIFGGVILIAIGIKMLVEMFVG